MNKLLLLLVVTVFLIVAVVLTNIGGDESPSPMSGNSAPKEAIPSSVETVPTAAEKDTYVNTILTVSAKYRDLEDRFQALLSDQEKVNKEIPTDADIDKSASQKAMQAADETRRLLEEKINSLRDSIERKYKQGQGDKNAAGSSGGGNIPQGLGFDDLTTSNANNSSGFSGSPQMQSGWSTVMPMGTEKSIVPGADGKIGSGILDWYSGKSKAPAGSQQQNKQTNQPVKPASSAMRTADPKKQIKPAYTIPRNATLFTNNTMTALLGVIPVEGSVLDPMRFKIITGNTNLATNGLYIPGVSNIVWSGVAIGNREMSCVRGELHSVTFTFEDGTIRTVSTGASGPTGASAGSTKILGYISDKQGSPCLKGQLITNASDYLKDRMIATGISTTGSAFAAAQQTTVVDATGAARSFFTGDQAEFIAGQALAGSFDELAKYMRERARNAVDLVYLDAGVEVVMHVEEQIDIDYDPNGRKLEYANPLSSKLSTSRYRLD